MPFNFSFSPFSAYHYTLCPVFTFICFSIVSIFLVFTGKFFSHHTSRRRSLLPGHFFQIRRYILLTSAFWCKQFSFPCDATIYLRCASTSVIAVYVPGKYRLGSSRHALSVQTIETRHHRSEARDFGCLFRS